jgi:MFS family permease
VTRRSVQGSGHRGLQRVFSALAIRNYRFFFIGQFISVTGSWMQKVAQDWLILEIGGGPLELSIGVALQSVPALVFGIWGGLLVDRVAHVRRILLATQVLLAALALGLGILTVTGQVNLTMVYVAAVAVGLVGVFDAPARQTFVFDMVGREHAANAVSLNSSINNSARLIGPAVGGVVIALAGTGIAYLVNATTFVAIVVALLMMDPRRLNPRPPAARARGQVVEGLRYSWAKPDIRTPLFATLLVSMWSQNFRVTLPLMAVTVFGGGASSYGSLVSALGLGALAGALICAYLARPSLHMIGWELLGFGVLMLLAAAAPTYVLLIVLMIGVGAGNTSFNTTTNALILLTADPGMRGRVYSIRTLLSRGSTPVGALGVGWICHVAGPRAGLAVGGAFALLAAVVSLRARRRSRHQLAGNPSDTGSAPPSDQMVR